jgi:hypothetical protein
MSKVFRGFLITAGMVFALEFLAANAEAVYLDLRFGLGIGAANANGTNIGERLLGIAPDKDWPLSTDYGFKIGIGPYFNNSLYFVGAFDAISQKYDFSSAANGEKIGGNDQIWIKYGSYLIGQGIVYYPLEFLQLSAVIGYAFGADSNSFGDSTVGAGAGMGYSLSAAYDIGAYKNNAFLIGLKWMHAIMRRSIAEYTYFSYPGSSAVFVYKSNDREITYNQTSLNVFVGYTFRTRKNTEVEDDIKVGARYDDSTSHLEAPNEQTAVSQRQLEKENAMLKGKVEAYERMLNIKN